MMPTAGSASLKLRPFDRLNLLSFATTFVLLIGVYFYCHKISGADVSRTTRHMMNYLGFTHYAVGYLFFFNAPAIQSQLKTRKAYFSLKFMACALLSAFFYKLQRFELLVYTLTYLHLAENAIFQILKLPADQDGPPFQANALFPMVLSLLLIRVFPNYLNLPIIPMRIGQIALVLAIILFVRSLLPSTDWREGFRLLGKYFWVAAFFAGVSIFVREASLPFDLFIIWHYGMWFFYTWFQKKEGRKSLVVSHLVFGIIYQTLYWTYANVPSLHSVLYFLVSPAAFLGQTVMHVATSFAFRNFKTVSKNISVALPMRQDTAMSA